MKKVENRDNQRKRKQLFNGDISKQEAATFVRLVAFWKSVVFVRTALAIKGQRAYISVHNGKSPCICTQDQIQGFQH